MSQLTDRKQTPSAMIGVHIPVSKMGKASRYMNTCQIFMGPPRQYFYPDERYIESLADTIQTSSMDTVIVHFPYTINLASTDKTVWKKSLYTAKFHLECMARIGLNLAVIHAGSGEKGKLTEALSSLGQLRTMLCLETDAGGGRRIGSLDTILEMRKKFGTGFALDTAHFYAREESPEDMAELTERERPEVIHLNEPDPVVTPASHLDRHNTIFGNGALGIETLGTIYNAARINNTPMIIEQDMETAIESMHILERFVHSSPAGD